MTRLHRAVGFVAALLILVTTFADRSAAAETVAPVPAQILSVLALHPLAFSLSEKQAAPQPSFASAQPVAPAAVARPLRDLVISFVNYGKQDAEAQCLAGAVYFEARGETLEGQLAVAQVIMNRAASGIYPPSICAVVTQPAQFSFIRGGRFPSIDKASDDWHKALAIADIARKGLARQQIAPNVLWYHASYVAPSWGRRLTRVTQVGGHIFYS